MTYSQSEVEQYIAEEDVKFIRLAFTDIFGVQKNVSIMPRELSRAFSDGISIDASAIPGFGGEVRSDLILHPDPGTLAVLPWRPERGRVVRMFCAITHPDGTAFAYDTRAILQRAVADAQAQGYSFSFGPELEFYLFQRDENGEPTKTPYDRAGYMDVSPIDKGENIRREICLILDQMGLEPESSHHEGGPGQNEIDFRYSDPVSAADAMTTFRFVVNTIATLNGLYADFSAKPLPSHPGNGLHINLSVHSFDSPQRDVLKYALAGLLEHICETTLFYNPTQNSYLRFGGEKAPLFVSWSEENRSMLARIPAAHGDYRRVELRSPDPTCNPYIAFTLAIRAALDGIKRELELPEPIDFNLYHAPEETTQRFKRLPERFDKAAALALESPFIAQCLPRELIENYAYRYRNNR
ncbi:MAG: glutamine synthetase family protein [Planctomycetia bacterium]|nr:glutamine synthetase family protein [Planctomycetia bacterium]